MNIKAAMQKHKGLFSFATKIFNFLNFRNHTFSIKNRVKIKASVLFGLKLKIHGRNNEIIINDFCKIKKCRISISGNNNKIIIGKECSLTETVFCIENNNNVISIGDRTAICGKTELSAIEGTRITIGEDCLFSSDIKFRTGDSHSILNLEGDRINPSEDIVIGDHVWVGTRVLCLKGSVVPKDCIIAASATVTKKFTEPNCILGGLPANVLKKETSWCKERKAMSSSKMSQDNI